MIINKLHIYGFGKFIDYQLDLSKNKIVLFGENEAGKSTIYAFIHAMLFGFPVKSLYSPHYEPSGFTRYGGKMEVEIPERGQIVIERLKGKDGSSCNVYLPDGTTGDETTLRELLMGMDRSYYESIYAFNLDGLQQIERLDEEQLGKFLFFAGISGSERLWEMENHYQKEMEALFKPGGKKPFINQKLQELKQSGEAIRKAREKEIGYNTYLANRRILKEKLDRNAEEIKKQNDELIHLKDWKRLFPLICEYQSVKNSLDELGDFSFPAGGISRMESLAAERLAKEVHLKSQEAKKKKLMEEASAIVVNEAIIEAEEKVRSNEALVHKMESLLDERKAFSIDDEHLKGSIQSLRRELHIPLTNEEILELDTSMFKKEEIRELELEKHSLEKKKNELDTRLEKERMKLEQIELVTDVYREKCLGEEERQELERKAEQYKEQSGYVNEKRNAEETLERLKDRKESVARDTTKINNKFFIPFIAILLLSGLAVSLMGEWGIGLTLMVVGLTVFLFWHFAGKKSDPTKELDREIEFLQHKLQKFENGSPDIGSSLNEVLRLLEEDQINRESYHKEQYRKEQQEIAFHTLIDAFEVWEKEKMACDNRLIELGEQWRLSKEISTSMLLPAFERIEKWKEQLLEQNRIHANLRLIDEKLHEYKAFITELYELFGIPDGVEAGEASIRMVKRLEEEKNKNRNKTQLLEKINEITEETSPLQMHYEEIVVEMNKLLDEAGCEELTAFYQRGKDADQRDRLLIQLEQLKVQLGKYAENPTYSQSSEGALDAALAEAEKRLNQLEEQGHEAREQLVEIQYEINRLEQDGTMEVLLHQHQILKEELRSLSKEWMKFATAKGALLQTIETYKEEKLPDVLAKAQNYVEVLTEGKYNQLLFSKEHSVLQVAGANGETVEARELSRGTAELIYVSIRLSLAAMLGGNGQWPIIIDDSFVNFDEKRTERMIALLEEIGRQNNQILFFTCHKHLLPYFKESEIERISS